MTTPAAPANPTSQMSTLERRAFSRLATPGGRMLVVAADQRNGMRAVMHHPDGPTAITAQELVEAKTDLVSHLGNHAPAILLDPEVAVPHVIDTGALAAGTALVVGLDASGFETVNGLRYTRYVPGMDPASARAIGADAIKMLWYLRPDQPESVQRVSAEIDDLLAACAEQGLLLIVEILLYQLDGESDADYAEALPDLIAQSAAIAVQRGSKVLKLPYPGSAQACAAVTRASAGVPWAVLSAGVDHATFIEQVRTAVAAGAAGAMAGRSLWKDSLAMTSTQRADLLASRARPRLAELIEVIDGTDVAAG